jgi:hypothetical protein
MGIRVTGIEHTSSSLSWFLVKDSGSTSEGDRGRGECRSRGDEGGEDDELVLQHQKRKISLVEALRRTFFENLDMIWIQIKDARDHEISFLSPSMYRTLRSLCCGQHL